MLKKSQFCKQLDAMDCDSASLSMVARLHGKEYSLEYLRNQSYLTKNGVSMLGISEAAEKIGFRTLAVKVPPEKLVKDAIVDVGQNSNHNWHKIFSDLLIVKCKFLEIRSYITLSLSKLIYIMELSDISILKNIDMYVMYNEMYDDIGYFGEILNKYPLIGNIIVQGCPKDKSSYTLLHQVKYIEELITSSECCCKISLFTFVTDLQMYNEGKNHNTCLNKKIAIDQDGLYRNCPSLKVDHGFHDTANILSIVNSTNFQYLWNIHKDEITACKDCEHRNICSDCRAFIDDIYDKPAKCNYNPYTGTWE